MSAIMPLLGAAGVNALTPRECALTPPPTPLLHRWQALSIDHRQHLIHKYALHQKERSIANEEGSEYLKGLLSGTAWMSAPPPSEAIFHGMEPSIEFRRWRTDSPVQRMMDTLVDEQPLGVAPSREMIVEWADQYIRREMVGEDEQSAYSPAFAQAYLAKMLQRTIFKLTKPDPPNLAGDFSRKGLNFGGAFYRRRLAAKLVAARSPPDSRPNSPSLKPDPPLKPHPPGRRPNERRRFETAREPRRKTHFVSVGATKQLDGRGLPPGTAMDRWAPATAALEAVQRALSAGRVLHGVVIATPAALFKAIDTDTSGFVEPVELRKSLERLGARLSADDFGLLFAAMDADSSGRLSYKEFSEQLGGGGDAGAEGGSATTRF